MFLKTIFFVAILLTLSYPFLLAQPQNLNQYSYAHLDSLMNLYHHEGAYNKSIIYAEQAMQKAKSEGQDSIYAEYLGNLSYLYDRTGLYKEAESFGLQAIEKKKQIFGVSHPLYAVSLNNLASLYETLGRYEKAEQLYLESKNIRKKVLGEQHPSYATVLSNLGLLYTNIGQYEEAEPFLIEAKNIRKKALGEQHPSYAFSLNNLAVLYFHLQKLDLAEPLWLQSMEIRKQALGENHPDYATAIDNLGRLYRDLGKYDKAEAYFIEARDIRKKTLGLMHPDYAHSIDNLAAFYEYIDDYAKAEPLYLQAIAIKEKTLGKQHYLYATSISNLARLYYRTAKYKEAEQFFYQAVEVLKEMPSQKQAYINIINNLAVLYYDGVKNPDLAFKYCYQAIKENCLWKDTFGLDLIADLKRLPQQKFMFNDHIITTLRIIHQICDFQYINTKNKEFLLKGYAALETAMQINEMVRLSFTAPEDKLRTLKEMSGLSSLAIASALELSKKEDKNYLANAFSYAEQNKSILLADAVKGNRARTLGDLPDSLALQEIELQQKKEKIQKEKHLVTDEVEKNKLAAKENELNTEIDNFLKSLKGKFPQYHALKYENITAKSNVVQDLLDEKTLMLEYFVTDTIIYLFSIGKKSLDLYALPISIVVLKKQIQNLRYALSNYKFISKSSEKAYELFSQSAYWFYKNILSIALDKHKNIQNLIVITDGELGHLPFEVFLTNSADQKETDYKNLSYLLHNYNISYNYSATLFVESQRNTQQNNNKKILACAAAYPKVDSSLLNLRLPNIFDWRMHLNPLPAAQNEVAALAEIFQGDFWQEKQSNERSFKEKASEYGIIHLAMHGILHQRVPMLSSLAFTEDRDSIEDNFLQAFEISKLKLNADLVVLSACETGYGKFEQGEGVMSLARSFMYAGTPSLVVSLWQVNDNSTAQIMKLFYQNLSNGAPKDIALRQAKLEYIKSANGITAHPAFWSPFIQLGDSHSISVKTKNDWSSWALGGLAIIALLGIFIIFKKRKNT